MSIRLLEHLRDELIQTGIVTNTPEFCRSWLGRSEGYIRVLRYNRIDPSVETLTICSNKVEPCRLPQTNASRCSLLKLLEGIVKMAYASRVRSH